MLPTLTVAVFPAFFLEFGYEVTSEYLKDLVTRRRTWIVAHPLVSIKITLTLLTVQYYECDSALNQTFL